MNKYIRRQSSYKKLVRIVNKNRHNFLVISVRYYIPWNPVYIICHLFAYLVILSSILKGRGKWAHSAYIYKFGYHPRIVEIVGSGVKHSELCKYFKPGFHGKVEIHAIPANISHSDRAKNIYFVDKKQLGKKYSIIKAMRAWFDFGKDQKDIDDKDYCTDNVIDAYERITNKVLVDNNAEWEPGELHDLCERRGYDLLYTIDSKKL